MLAKAETRFYEKGGWRIHAAFLNIISPAVRVEYWKTNHQQLSAQEVELILVANAAGLTWSERLFQHPSLKGAQLGAPILGHAMGMKRWQRSDGAEAWLLAGGLRLELPAAKLHEKHTDEKRAEKIKQAAPQF